MMLSVWSMVLSVLLLVCLGSFRWGMSHFFSRPAGRTVGMKVINACGTLFAALHLSAVLTTPAVTPQRGWAAVLLYLWALGLYFWAIRTNSKIPLSAAFSPDSPRHLVDRGPYRFIRHPFYSSYLLTWAAGFLATGQLWLGPTLAIMLLVYLKAARMEEQKFTSSPLASRYEQYRSRTGLFFPNPFKLLTPRRSG